MVYSLETTTTTTTTTTTRRAKRKHHQKKLPKLSRLYQGLDAKNAVFKIKFIS